MEMTTIQLSKSTVQRLKSLKEGMGASSYDQLIVKLIPKKVPKSLFGAHPEMKSFTEEDRMKFREL